MTLTNPYDYTKPDEPSRSLRPANTGHHTTINKKIALELCEYSNQAYAPKDKQERTTAFLEHSVFLENDAQCMVYTKGEKKVVSFRGTQEAQDWLTDLNTVSVKLSTVYDFITDENDLWCHRGFATSLRPLYPRIKKEIEGHSFDLCGHSYGGALATIFGYLYAIDTGKQPDNFYTFGSPRVFMASEEYPVSRFNDLTAMVRIQNDNDIISYYPQKGGYEAIAKHGGAGGVVGGAIGAIGGGGVVGALIGSVVGGGIGVASGGFVHVGTGIILFEENNPIVYTGTGREKLLKGRNYYLMPEGEDLMRDPLDLSSTISHKIIGMGMVEGAFEMVRRLYSNYAGFSDFLAEGRRDGVIARAKNIFNVNVRGWISSNLVRRVSQSRHTESVYTNAHNIYNANRFRNDAGMTWAEPSQYLSGRLLVSYENWGAEMLRATSAWLGRITYQEAGFNAPIQRGDLDIYNRVFVQLTEGLMQNQLIADTAIAKKFYTMLGMSMVVESGLVAFAGYDVYTKTVGHKLINYKSRVFDLPETIYQGFASDEKFFSNNDYTFTQVADNIYTSNGMNYYLSHNGNKTTMKPMTQKILGYIMYSPEEEASHLHQMVVF